MAASRHVSVCTERQRKITLNYHPQHTWLFDPSTGLDLVIGDDLMAMIGLGLGASSSELFLNNDSTVCLSTNSKQVYARSCQSCLDGYFLSLFCIIVFPNSYIKTVIMKPGFCIAFISVYINVNILINLYSHT